MQYAKLQTLLKAENVGLSFFDKETNEEKVILSEINIEIKDIVTDIKPTGQIVSLVGKSGTGKTQLLRRLSGLYTPNAKLTGEVLVNKDKVQGEHVLTPVREGDMGIVFQDYYLPEHLRIRKMMVKAAAKNTVFKGDMKVINDAIDSYINQFELVEHQNKYPCQLSGGQKQRASITLQLLNGSNFILMDEPFSGLDPLMIDKTTKYLQVAANSDELKTLIIVSHDLVNCAAISDTIFVLSKTGRKEGTGASIIQEFDLLKAGLAYNPEIKRMPEFHNVIDEVKQLL